jgi:hypothetical protein
LVFEFKHSQEKGHRIKRENQASYMMTIIVDGNFGQARLPYQMGMNTGNLKHII